MLDNKNRIMIPKEFKVSESGTEVRFFYDLNQKLFYIFPRKIPGAFLIGITNLDEEGKATVPKIVTEVYGTKNIFCAEHEEKIFLIPIKKD